MNMCVDNAPLLRVCVLFICTGGSLCSKCVFCVVSVV